MDIPAGALRLVLAAPARAVLAAGCCDVDSDCCGPAAAVYTFYRTQLAGQRVPYAIEVGPLSVDAWSPGEYIAANGLRRPFVRQSTGLLYTTTAQGETGANEPKWGTTAGSHTPDGSLNWLAVTPIATGQDTIEQAVWGVAGQVSSDNISSGVITIGTNAQNIGTGPLLDTNGSGNSQLATWGYVLGGTPGLVYLITASIAMTSGAIYLVQLVITIQ